jgi:hypothetical protein
MVVGFTTINAISAYHITGFLTKVTRRAQLMEQELLTASELLSSHWYFCDVRVV